MIIAFGEYAPDRAPLNQAGSPLIKNVFPGGPYNGRRQPTYLPVPALQVISDALGKRPRGAISARDKDGNVFNYVGDETKLYELEGSTAQSWTDVTNTGGAYATGADERWEFTRWKNKVLATNFSDNPQSITFGDANFADLTTTLRFRHISAIRSFVVTGNTFDGSDGNVPVRVRWSAFDDETDWTVSATTLASFFDLKGQGGWVQAVVGGEFGVVIQERSSWRMSFVGSPSVFQFDETAPGIGALNAGSVAQYGSFVFFLSQDGFILLENGVATQNSFIGQNKIDRTVLADIDTENFNRVSAVIDPVTKRYLMAYPGSGNIGGRPNKIVVFDWVNRNWALIEDDVELLWRASSIGFNLDELDDFALKSELVTNGDFSSDSDWTKGTGWTISGGTATHGTGSESDIEQTVSITEDVYYRVEFDVSNRTAGSLTPKVGGTSGTAVTSNTTDEKETIRAGSGSLLEFTATSDFDGDLDNVSLKEITDMDELADSLDSRTYVGGQQQLAAFDENFTHGFFSGTAMDATLETKELQFFPGRTAHLNAFRPLVDGAAVTVTAQVGSRSKQAESPSFDSTLSESSSGRFTTRKNARFHQIRILTSGDFDHAIGVEILPEEIKEGGLRG